MAKFLKMAQFVYQHRVTQVQIRRRWIEASLNTQRLTGFNALNQISFDQQFIATTLDQLQAALDVYHIALPTQSQRRIDAK